MVYFLFQLTLLPFLLSSTDEAKFTQYGHFYIYYVYKDEAQAQIAGKVLQTAWDEFNKNFNLPLDSIYVYIIRSPEDFSKFTGGRSPFTYGGVAKPARNQIIVKSPNLRKAGEDFAGTLRHELVHILLHRSGIESRIPLWLNEGVAMLLANEYQWGTRLKMSFIVLSNRLIDYKDLDKELVLSDSPDATGTAYVQSLYLTQLLWSKLGEEKFWRLLNECRVKDFPTALRDVSKMSIEDFIQEFKKSLWAVVILGALATGSIFTPIALLAIVAYFAVRHRNLDKLKKWEEEEREDEALGIRTIPWEHILSEPYDFEEDDE
ncbi:MAG: hypothetical protein N3G21_07045 [Candidatus Hydrogenedentes bacterium]|nr:hypothetical protein [Candidatus Hydrogenedentota bacterium]